MNREDLMPTDEPVTHTVVRAGDTFSFRNDAGRHYPVTIESSRWIGEGGFGAIYAVRCRMEQLLREQIPPTPVEPCDRVIKSFHSGGDALQAKRKHDLLRHHHLPVFHLYHLNEPKEMILMPDGNESGVLTVSQNISLAKEDLKHAPLHSISNFEGLLHELAAAVRRATRCGILVPCDAYFFSVMRERQNGASTFSLDDTDNIEGDNAGLGIHLIFENIRGVRDALEIFINDVVEQSKREKYLRRMTEYCATLQQELCAMITREEGIRKIAQ